MRVLFRLIWQVITLPFRWIKGVVEDVRFFLTEEPDDAPIADSFQKAMENPSGLLVHLDALRKHLTRAVIVLAVAVVISFTFSSQIIDFLAQPVGGMNELVAIDPTEPISTFMRVSLLSGFVIALPYIILELWLFIGPGLSRESRMFGLYSIPVALVFFVGGLAFSYYVMLPTAIPFLINFMGMTTQLRPSSYIRFVIAIMFWIGVAFLFPLIIYVLARVGLIRGEVLAKQWRLAIVIMAVAAALITPTVDPVNMSLVLGPLLILYALSIGLAKIAERGRRARQARQAEAQENSINPTSP